MRSMPIMADAGEGSSISLASSACRAPGRYQAAQQKLCAGLDARLQGHDGGPGSDQKRQRIDALRQIVAGLENGALTPAAPSASLPLGAPELEAHLAGGAGLACGVLHEVMAAAYADQPAAFGFSFALTACAQQARAGPAVFVASRRALADFGSPYGHGLHQHGLDVGRLLLVETRTDKDALWAIEEALRSQAAPAVVTAAVTGDLDFTMSRRLNLAAGAHRTPLVLLRTTDIAGTSAAATRWRIGSAPAARDRYGSFAGWRWRVALERCRNGRPGEWLIEWDHVAHRFRLAEELADRAPVARAELRRVG